MSSRDQQGSNEADKRSNTKEPTKNEYPDARIIANEAFEIRYGTQDGKQFYQFFGPGGTMHTVYADGTHDIKNVGEKKEYNKSGVTITVDENNDVHIKGHNKIQVGGGAHIEVSGDAGIVAGKNVALATLGNLGIKAKNIYMGATGNFNLAVDGKMTLSSTGASIFESQAPMHVGSGGTITVQGTTTSLNPGGGGSGYTNGGEA